MLPIAPQCCLIKSEARRCFVFGNMHSMTGYIHTRHSRFWALSPTLVLATLTVNNWNSPEFGSCWKSTYADTGVTAIAIDTVYSGFDLSGASSGTLTLGNAGPSFSEIDVESTEVDPSYCGL